MRTHLAYLSDCLCKRIATVGNHTGRLPCGALGYVDGPLPGNQFQRVHRNALVNVSHIRKLSALGSQRWLITGNNALQKVVGNYPQRLL